MTIRQTKMLREFRPTLKPKEDSHIFIACFIANDWTATFFRQSSTTSSASNGSPPGQRGMWHYIKYHFTPNKKTKIVKIQPSFWLRTLPMTSINRYGVETVAKKELYYGAHGAAVPKTLIQEMNNQLNNSEVNWLNLEKPWINKYMMESMKEFYSSNNKDK